MGELGSVLRESEVEAHEVIFFVAVRLALELHPADWKSETHRVVAR